MLPTESGFFLVWYTIKQSKMYFPEMYLCIKHRSKSMKSTSNEINVLITFAILFCTLVVNVTIFFSFSVIFSKKNQLIKMHYNPRKGHEPIKFSQILGPLLGICDKTPRTLLSRFSTHVYTWLVGMYIRLNFAQHKVHRGWGTDHQKA